jgi:hypothetical protein
MNWLKKTIIALVIICAVPMASAISLNGSIPAFKVKVTRAIAEHQCELLLLLNQVGPEYFQNIRTIAAGLSRQVTFLMELSGVASHPVHSYVAHTLEELGKATPFLGLVEQSLHREEGPGAPPLILCMGNVGCLLNNKIFPSSSGELDLPKSEDAGWILQPQNFLIAPVATVSSKGIFPERLKRKEYLFLRPLDTRAVIKAENENRTFTMAHPDSKSIMRDSVWFGHFFREVAKYQTMRFLGQWYESNVKLLKRGEIPDSFFHTYVKNSNGRVAIDPQLFYFLIYSRGVRAWAEAERHNMLTYAQADPVITAALVQQEQGYWRAAVYGLQGLVGEAGIQSFGITSDNIYTLSGQLVGVMAQTIERAK